VLVLLCRWALLQQQALAARQQQQQPDEKGHASAAAAAAAAAVEVLTIDRCQGRDKPVLLMSFVNAATARAQSAHC